MIAKSEIKATLVYLKKDYGSQKSSLKRKRLASKLAILELSGWAEQTIENIIIHDFNRRSRFNSKFKAKMQEKIERNHGFKANSHLYGLIVSVVGYVGLERLEKKCDKSKISNLLMEMNALYDQRCALAHDYLRYKAGGIDAPSKTMARFQKIYDGLEEVDKKLRLMK